MLNIILWIVGGVIGLVVLYIAFMIAGTVWTMITGVEPKGVEVDVSAPASCAVGDDISVDVEIRDTLGRARSLRSVDLAATYLKGLVVQRVEPAPKQMPSEPTLGMYIFPMAQQIAASGSVTVRFHCRAALAGDFAGEVTVYVDSGAFRYIRRPIRTIVS